jgi:hypothetical protein
MIRRLTFLVLSAAACAVFAQAPVATDRPLPGTAQTSSGANISVQDGSHNGEYGYSEPCVLAAFGKRPLGLSVVLHGTDSVLSIDMPLLDDKHANEIQIVLVIAEIRAGKGPSSVTYEIDTRPDATLEPFQKAERANKGVTGKASTTLMQKDGSVLLSFSGTTAGGAKLDGSVTCRRMG